VLSVDVRLVTAAGAEHRPIEELPALLSADDGFVWVDVAELDAKDERLLAEVFGFHPMALAACRERNHLPSTHAYPDYVFTVLHAPERGAAGHVHLLELDQFVGRRYLVTVHGPLNPDVPLEHALTETQAVLARIERGHLHASTSMELSYAIVTALARRQRDLVTEVAKRVAALEREVMADDFRNPERLLDAMFLVRHELLTVRTMAAQSHDVYARLARLGHHVPAEDKPLLEDLSDQFDRLRSLSDGEKEFLFGVIDLYQTRVATKMTVAVERLAVLAAITLPITALASIYGMNVIVNSRTHVVQLVVVLAVMAVVSGTLLRWSRRQGWW
jgi:Mg2+ and Co2+ transporter CorA